ncbi:MAG: BA14K family protein [Pseudomonadota bacterium]
MRRITTAAVAALAAFASAIAVVGQTNAAPLAASALKPALPASDVVKVGKGGFSITIRSGRPYYRGFRGHRKFRSGYVFYNGFYFPRHAVRPRVVHRPRVVRPRVLRLSNAHIRWCYGRYKTYRHHDNTFAYRVGKRTYCRSPYGG